MDVLPSTFLGWELAGVTSWLAASPNPRHGVWEQPWAPHSGWNTRDDLWRDSSKENPFWVITRGSLLTSPMRTDFQKWLSYPQRNKPQNMVPKSKEFCSFHGESPAQPRWDEILGLAPWKSTSEAFETFPQTSSAVPTPGIPSKTPQDSQTSPDLWSQPVNGQKLLPHDL